MLTMTTLVTTSAAAKTLGISSRTLQKWATDGVVTADFVTVGGHYRWDVDNLRAQLRAMRQRDE